MTPNVSWMDIFCPFLLFLVSLQQIHYQYEIHCNAISLHGSDTKNVITESKTITTIGKIVKWIKFNAIRQKNMIQGSFRSEFEEYSVCLHC